MSAVRMDGETNRLDSVCSTAVFIYLFIFRVVEAEFYSSL